MRTGRTSANVPRLKLRSPVYTFVLFTERASFTEASFLPEGGGEKEKRERRTFRMLLFLVVLLSSSCSSSSSSFSSCHRGSQQTVPVKRLLRGCGTSKVGCSGKCWDGEVKSERRVFSFFFLFSPLSNAHQEQEKLF